MIDENSNYQSHTNLAESKISKNRLKSYLKVAYTWTRNGYIYDISQYSFVHSYINYGKIARANTSKSKLKKKWY